MNMLVIRTILPIIAISSMFSGCTIGNGRICGPQTPMVYCDKKAYDALFRSPSSMEKWQEVSGRNDIRQQDWVACGGLPGGGVAGISGGTSKETADLSSKKFDGVQLCMMDKGYKYTGTCDGEIPSQYPACQSPKPNR
ncbi:hypothetical protein RE432_10410 [Pusillimonas sp. SM2304]|uniref:hypothetical protein n=1 Tax=Pusillimonas sp. SM2304 TaxID=3073241 RepID=UPI0028760723|nr:hypothetical protein [Pusillimonas sp. SM2304]MDS1140847.1 hypothetical protein [Pusillimonas sp. SM2304]